MDEEKEKDLQDSMQKLSTKINLTEDKKIKPEHNKQDLVALEKNRGSSSSLEREMDCRRRENNKILL